MPEDIEQIRKAAAKLDCLVEEDFYSFAGITPKTARSWRNRGHGPKPILFGTRYFYPFSAIREAMEQRGQEQTKQKQSNEDRKEWLASLTIAGNSPLKSTVLK